MAVFHASSGNLLNRGFKRLAAAVLLTASMAFGFACGAPLDSGPQAIDPARLPPGLRVDASTTSTTQVPGRRYDAVTVFLLTDERLKPVSRVVEAPVTVQAALEQLDFGPTITERRSGVGTALSSGTIAGADATKKDIVTVRLTDTFLSVRIDRQIAVLAQIVYTATDLPGIAGVTFEIANKLTAVPDQSGALSSVPVGRAAYAALAPRE